VAAGGNPASLAEFDGKDSCREPLWKRRQVLVAKDPTSPYVGGRTLKWLKVKQPKYREQ
jgi:ATP-dependent DNA ligase